MVCHYYDVYCRDDDSSDAEAKKIEHLELAKLLIENGAHVNVQNKDGETPLYNACFFEDLEMVQLLIGQGANLGVTTRKGATPLHEA